MDFRISDRGQERKACYTTVINKTCKGRLRRDSTSTTLQHTLNSTLANERTVYEFRYHNFGLDSEMQ